MNLNINTALSLIDKMLFFIGGLIGLQISGSLQQYSQQLSEHLNKITSSLEQYTLMAKKSFNGNLNALIESFSTSKNEQLINISHNINDILARADELRESLSYLQQANIFQKIFYCLTDLESDIVWSTLANFQWSVPLTITAFFWAFVIALLASGLFNLSVYLIKRAIRWCTTPVGEY